MMEAHKKGIPYLVFLSAFVLAAGGRFAALSSLEGTALSSAAARSVFFGLRTGSIFYYVYFLIIASGLLQRKIFNMIILLLLGVFLSISHRFLTIPVAGDGFYSVIVVAILWILDRRDSRKRDYVLDSSNKLPKTHRRPRVLTNLYSLFFRLFPSPVPVGLYQIGKPDNYSDILVTGNFSLTVRKAVKALRGTNCWLMVCDSRGINIWCSTLAGHFGTDQIIQALNLTGVAEKTRSRNLVLPQLCAAGVSLETIKEKTGFTCRFGPVRIEDYKTYKAEPSNSDIRRVVFPMLNRVEMAFGTVLIPAAVLFFIYNFIDLSRLFILLPAALFAALINALTFQNRFIRNVYLWSFLFAGSMFGISHLILQVFSIQPVFSSSLAIGLVSLYLVNEFEGWSPLVKFDMFSSYTKPVISVDQDTCTGCSRCIQVCPKEVFDLIENRSSPVRLSECVSCRACLVQCPEKAISDRQL